MKLICVISAYIMISTACGSPVQESNNLPERSGMDSGVANAQVDSSRSDIYIQGAQDTATLNGLWFLVPALASDTAAGKFPTINFDLSAKQFTGNTGCNTMRGKFDYADSILKIDQQIITTKMACPGYNEDAFLKNLAGTNGHKFENGMLVLLNNGAEASRWTRTKVKPEIIKSM